MEKTALVVQEDNLQRFKLLGEFTSSNVGVYVENLTFFGLCQAAQDGKSACTYRCFDRAFVNLSDFSNKTVLLAIEIVGGENTGGDGTRAAAQTLQCGDEFEVLFEEDSTCNL